MRTPSKSQRRHVANRRRYLELVRQGRCGAAAALRRRMQAEIHRELARP